MKRTQAGEEERASGHRSRDCKDLEPEERGQCVRMEGGRESEGGGGEEGGRRWRGRTRRVKGGRGGGAGAGGEKAAGRSQLAGQWKGTLGF